MSNPLRAPFPWVGGKRRVAPLVWPRLGEVPNYIEPFAGSLAMLLARPGGPGKIETVNDIDRYVANFWRAIKADPWAVAEWCDDPVNEADLHARHKWLVNQTEFREAMHTDPEYFDVKVAGWWVWGLCQWIGGGWCAEPNNRKHPKLDGIGKGVHSIAGAGTRAEQRGRPNLTNDRGVFAPSRQLPDLAVTADGMSTGRGVHSASAYSPGRRPALASAGQGVHLPSLGNDKGIHGTLLRTLRELDAPDGPPCFEWFARLALRLRHVRVACGDWSRVLGNSVLGKGKNVGGRRPCAVFLDPPYDPAMRCSYLYTEDSAGISSAVRLWALEHGDDPDLRIALCGYEGEHEMPATWECVEWKAARGYASDSNENRAKERIWFSPHCLRPESAHQRQGSLFSVEALHD